MRYLLVILLILAPLPAIALTGPAARFDFSQGAPAIAADQTTACNNQATVRYDFSIGAPAQVFDTTATCTEAAVVTTAITPRLQLINGKVIQNSGTIIIK